MRRRDFAIGVIALSFGAAASVLAAPVPKFLTAALADKGRPEADVKRDAARKPAELLAFAGLKPGARVADFVMGGGYFTRILAAAVGPKGSVLAYQPAEFIQFRAAYADEQKAAASSYANITADSSSFMKVTLPSDLDLVLTVQNYHDMHLSPFPKDMAARVNAEIFRALKPGGVYLVVDHAATAGSGLAAANTLHRIDVAAVKSEVEAAGFKLAAESPMLASAADPHTDNVFSPAIRGKTDQFILKFVKPSK